MNKGLKPVLDGYPLARPSSAGSLMNKGLKRSQTAPRKRNDVQPAP